MTPDDGRYLLLVLSAAYRIHIFPGDFPSRRHLDQASALGLGDERIAVLQPMGRRAQFAVELVVGGSLPRPDFLHGHRIDLDDARRVSHASIIAVVVEKQDMAVGEGLGIVLAGPGAGRAPNDLLHNLFGYYMNFLNQLKPHQ